MRLYALIAAFLFALSACETSAPPSAPALPEFAFSAAEPIRLNVSRIEFQSAYVPPLKAPNREHEFRTAPSDVVRAWADKRLAAVGGEGVLTVRILEGGVTETALPRDNRFGRVFSSDPDRRLDAVIQVELVYEAPSAVGRIEAETTGAVDINQHASLNETEAQYFAMLTLMSERLNATLTQRLLQAPDTLIAD